MNLVFLTGLVCLLCTVIGFAFTVFAPFSRFSSSEDASSLGASISFLTYLIGFLALTAVARKYNGLNGTRSRTMWSLVFFVSLLVSLLLNFQASRAKYSYHEIKEANIAQQVDPSHGSHEVDSDEFDVFSFVSSTRVDSKDWLCNLVEISTSSAQTGMDELVRVIQYCVSPILGNQTAHTNVVFWALHSEGGASDPVPPLCNANCMGLKKSLSEEPESLQYFSDSIHQAELKFNISASSDTIFVELISNLDEKMQNYYEEFIEWILAGSVFSLITFLGGLLHAVKTGFRWSRVSDAPPAQQRDEEDPFEFIPTY